MTVALRTTSADHDPASARRRTLLIALAAGTICFAAAATAITYRTWIDTLIWARFDAECGQILLAPAAFVSLLYARRHVAATTLPAGWSIGPIMAGIGWAAWSFGFYHSHDLYWHAGALLLVIGAAIAWLGGERLARFWPAFLVLVFLIPVSGFGREYVAAPLQNVTTRVTQALCEAAGMTVGRYGSVLQINGHEVAIAEACNGLRMIWPLFLASYLFAFITPMRGWVRAVVLAASPAIAVGANVLRLVPTVWAYGHWDLQSATAFHDRSGWVMLALSFFSLVAIARVLRWALPASSSTSTSAARQSEDEQSAPQDPTHWRYRLGAIGATAVVLAGSAWEAWSMPVEADAAPYHALLRSSASQAPDRIGTWVGRDVPVPDNVPVSLQPNLVISREYTDGRTGLRATLLLVQVNDARQIIWHAPTHCYDVSGWQLLNRKPHDWVVGDVRFPGMEYEFSRGSFQRSASIAVADFMLLPDGRVARDMQPVREWAEMATRRFYGAAHLQIVCDAALPRAQREEMVRELLTGYIPLLHIIGSGVHPEHD